MTIHSIANVKIGAGDALLVIDVQNDFLPGGSLAVPDGHAIIPLLNHCIRDFESKDLPIFFTRDWHPQNHCSFQGQKGKWPAHCVQNSPGAAFPAQLYIPKTARIISKATTAEKDVYSGFEDTDLDAQLKALKISRVFVGGLATDYCVLSTVRDACRLGYKVYVLEKAIKGINASPDDERNAIHEMKNLGVNFM